MQEVWFPDPSEELTTEIDPSDPLDTVTGLFSRALSDNYVSLVSYDKVNGIQTVRGRNRHDHAVALIRPAQGREDEHAFIWEDGSRTGIRAVVRVERPPQAKWVHITPDGLILSKTAIYSILADGRSLLLYNQKGGLKSMEVTSSTISFQIVGSFRFVPFA